MSRSARINFGYPNSEIVVSCADTGEITSAKNVSTGTEYIGVNPNRVETITGMVASVWDDLPKEDALRFVEAFNRGDASAQMVCDLSDFGGGDAVELSACEGTAAIMSGGSIPIIKFGYVMLTDESPFALEVEFTWRVFEEPYIKNVNIGAYMNGEVTDMSEYKSLVPATLTIYWHPMPEA